ncbi:MAG: NAD(P)/FAD-dependent oxidoreductase [Promethearchaeia archaeon]
MANNAEEYEILIVGAGPSGAVAARVAAENGLDICLLEKKNVREEGRYKACGGALAWELVEELDYPEDKISRIIESLELHHIDGTSYSKRGKGAVVWRSIFDKHFSDLAQERGAELHDEEPLVQIQKKDGKYKIQTPAGTYITKYVIAADGVNSRTLRQLNWPSFAKSDLILTITKEMKTTPSHIVQVLGDDAIHLFFGKSLISVGYAWLFPKERTITVGWGNQINLISNSREEFKKYVSLPYVKKALKGAQLEIFQPHLIPVGLRPQISKDNVLAVGDAGGIVDPISGKGIPYAMMSGKFAVQAILKAEEKDRPEKLGTYYRQLLDKKFLRILKAKRKARDKIFQSDENLKKFLSLWENHRSSEIVMRKLL